MPRCCKGTSPRRPLVRRGGTDPLHRAAANFLRAQHEAQNFSALSMVRSNSRLKSPCRWHSLPKRGSKFPRSTTIAPRKPIEVRPIDWPGRNGAASRNDSDPAGPSRRASFACSFRGSDLSRCCPGPPAARAAIAHCCNSALKGQCRRCCGRAVAAGCTGVSSADELQHVGCNRGNDRMHRNHYVHPPWALFIEPRSSPRAFWLPSLPAAPQPRRRQGACSAGGAARS